MKASGENTTDKSRFLLELYRKAQSLYDKELYDYFLDHAVEVTKSKIGFFHIVSCDQKTIKLTTWNKETLRSCTANYITHYPIELAGNWVDCVYLKRPVIFNDFHSSPNQKGLPKGHIPLTRFVSMPIIDQDKVTAIFGVGNKIDPYTEADIIQLEYISNELNKIMKQRQAEAELIESKEKYQALFANMMDGFAYCQMLLDKDGPASDFLVLEANQAFLDIFRTNNEALVGKKASELMGLSHFGNQVIGKASKVALCGANEKFEIEIKPLNLWLSMALYSPKKGYFAAVFQDITERKRAEQALIESEERLQLKLDSVLSPYVELGENELANVIDVPSLQATMDSFYAVTKMGFALIDLKGKVLVGTGWQDICTKFHRNHPETCRNCIESDLELSRGVKRGQIHFYKCKNHMWDVVTPLYIADKHVGNVFFGQFFFADEVPDRKLFEAQAEKYGFNKEAYLAAFDRIPKYSRKEAEALMLFYSRLSEKVSKISHSNLKLAKALNTQKALQFRLEEKAAEVEEYASQMEELAEDRARQLKDSERLSAIGATAGMVGHDIRNPLQAITNHLYLTRRKTDKLPNGEIKSGIEGSIQNIEENLRYINKIVADLQDFAAPLNPKQERLKVRDALQDALSMVNIPENVIVSVDAPCTLPALYADYTMIKRILINLMQNAIQAMPTGGKLTASAITKGNNIEFIIADTGEGIPLQVQAKIFTPLITTKPKGQGFGLAVVKRMTEAMGGEITFETELGKGTKFIIRFPI